jgi:hypothetical protein
LSTDVEDTPLFAKIAGKEAERVVALISGTTRPPTSEALLAQHPSAS